MNASKKKGAESQSNYLAAVHRILLEYLFSTKRNFARILQTPSRVLTDDWYISEVVIASNDVCGSGGKCQGERMRKEAVMVSGD